MEDPRYIATSWGVRKESAEECARRLQSFLAHLSQLDPLFGRWFKGSKSLKQALTRPLEFELSALTQYVQSKIMRDSRPKPMEDMGFSFSLWNGCHGGNDAWLRVGCGGYWERVRNTCVLDAPYKGPGSERVRDLLDRAGLLQRKPVAGQ